jgi:hypothetical protein
MYSGVLTAEVDVIGRNASEYTTFDIRHSSRPLWALPWGMHVSMIKLFFRSRAISSPGDTLLKCHIIRIYRLKDGRLKEFCTML